MKKIIVLLLVISMCLSSCSLILDEAAGSSDSKTENTGTGTGSGTGTGAGSGTGTGSGTGSGSGTGTGTGTGDCESDGHTDLDNDGECDNCSISVIVLIDVFAINDLHGKIKPTDSQYGIGGLTTYLKNEADDNSIILSSGDMWQGSAESNLTYGAFITDWMSEVGFSAMTLGNHEYDWGESYVYENEELASFPFLAINVYDNDTGKRAEYATPSVVVERDGIEIGIIGAIGDCHSSISGDVNGGFTFKVGDELTELVKDEAERLKDEGVDFIIYSIHDGYGSSFSYTKTMSDSALSSYYDTELSDGYVDLVFEGHTHQSYVLRDSHGVYHLQGSGENKGLSHAEISINTANGSTGVKTAKIVKSSEWQSLASDPLVDELLLKYEDEISAADRVLGYNSAYRDDSEIEQIVADLYYQYGVEKWGEQYDIILAGGFIRTRNPYNLYEGTVKYSDIYSLLPFDNELVLCSISGSDLYYKFINTDNSDYYIAYNGNDISNIDMNKTYYVVVDSYTSTYAYNNLTEIARYGTNVYARDLLAKYIEDGNLD